MNDFSKDGIVKKVKSIASEQGENFESKVEELFSSIEAYNQKHESEESISDVFNAARDLILENKKHTDQMASEVKDKYCSADESGVYEQTLREAIDLVLSRKDEYERILDEIENISKNKIKKKDYTTSEYGVLVSNLDETFRRAVYFYFNHFRRFKVTRENSIPGASGRVALYLLGIEGDYLDVHKEPPTEINYCDHCGDKFDSYRVYYCTSKDISDRPVDALRLKCKACQHTEHYPYLRNSKDDYPYGGKFYPNRFSRKHRFTDGFVVVGDPKGGYCSCAKCLEDVELFKSHAYRNEVIISGLIAIFYDLAGKYNERVTKSVDLNSITEADVAGKDLYRANSRFEKNRNKLGYILSHLLDKNVNMENLDQNLIEISKEFGFVSGKAFETDLHLANYARKVRDSMVSKGLMVVGDLIKYKGFDRRHYGSVSFEFMSEGRIQSGGSLSYKTLYNIADLGLRFSYVTEEFLNPSIFKYKDEPKEQGDKIFDGLKVRPIGDTSLINLYQRVKRGSNIVQLNLLVGDFLDVKQLVKTFSVDVCKEIEASRVDLAVFSDDGQKLLKIVDRAERDSVIKQLVFKSLEVDYEIVEK